LARQPDEAAPAPRADRALASWLIGWARPYWRRILAATALVLAGSALQVVGPLLTAAAIDLYLEPREGRAGAAVAALLRALHLPNQGGWGLFSLSLIYFATLLAAALVLTIQARTMQMTGQLVMRDLRDRLFAHLQRLDLAWFNRTPAGRVITRLTNDVEAVNEVFTSGLVDIMADVVLLAGIVTVLFSLDWRLALVTFAVLPFLVVLSLWFRGRARAVYREVRSRLAAINTHLQEHIAGMSVVQLARAEARTAANFVTIDAAHRDVNVRGIFYYAVFYPAVDLLTGAGLAMLLVFGGIWTYDGTVSLGVLVAFLQYVQRFYRPISDLAENFNVLQSALAAAERLQALLATQPGVSPPANPAREPARSGSIRFDGVWFAYEEEHWALRDVAFSIRPGERVAVVGHTGAGKSTLVNLLLRFHDVQRGRISVDGVDVRDWDPSALRSRFAVVLQEIDCFAGTVGANVRLGRAAISDERARWALHQIGAGPLLDRLPHGLETELGERGSGLSTGERQLVSFARALVGDPEFVVLDEATASVDPTTEAIIHRALARLLSGRSALIIAHRLATVVGCDRVLVFHGGALVEQGTHDELLAMGGVYKTLYELQLLRPAVHSSPAAGSPTSTSTMPSLTRTG
jgi:ATP-binding cassette subfamily B protein